MKRKSKQILIMAITVVLAVIAGGSLYLYMWLKNSVPNQSGEIVIDGVEQDIEITYDKMGIPQIWAKTERDGFLALGYLHASDRMFQMDMARRMSQGRMSELLGDVTLEMDKKQRQIGHNRMAKKALSNLDQSSRMRFESYADGVNAYKKISGAPPFEYLLLGATFEDWTVTDCLTLLSFQTWYSDALQNHDNFYAELKEKLGEEKANSLCLVYPNWAPVTIPESKKFGQTDSDLNKKIGKFSLDEINSYLMSNSSNAWVIGPNKSKSGRAILSSDPHLQITQLPQFWYMVGIHIEETNLNVLGISTPGLPFVIMGHNSKAAWAFTAGGIDVTQFYSEQINPEDSEQYKTPTGWKNFERVADTILVSGLDTPVVLSTKLTRHGPILISDDKGEVKSFRWAGFDADINLAAKSGFELMQVNEFSSIQKIVTTLGALNAHWVYADSNGNIGYQLGTPIPVRDFENSCIAVAGWTDEFEWNGYYPLSKTPFSFNPSQDWLATSNNLPSRSLEFPSLSGSFAADRIMRISELLTDHKMVSADDCREFQLDRTDSYLKKWRWEIARQLISQGNHDLAERINNWDGNTSPDSKETAIVMVYISQLRKLTFEDKLGEMYSGVRTIWLDQIFNSAELEYWFDDSRTELVESRDDISLKSVENAIDIVGNKSWGDFNTLSMRHPMSEIPVLGSLLDLNCGTWSWPGTAGTLNASYVVSRNDSTFETIVGPSWRFVIDFADIDAALFVLPAGNSGNPMSPHFFDFNQMWQKGEYWNIPISYERVKANAVSTLILKSFHEPDQN